MHCNIARQLLKSLLKKFLLPFFSLKFLSLCCFAQSPAEDSLILHNALYWALLDKESELWHESGKNPQNLNLRNDLLLLAFATSAHQTREQYLPQIIKRLLKQNPSSELKHLAQYLLTKNEFQQIKKLNREILYQRTSGIFNHISSATSQLLSGDTGVLGELGVNSVYYFFASRSLLDRERKIKLLLSQVLQKDWQMPETEKIKLQKRMNKLSQKQRSDEIKRNLRRLRFFTQQGGFNTAEFYLSQAQHLAKLSSDDGRNNKELRRINKWRWRLAATQGQQLRLRLADNSVVREHSPNALQRDLLSAMLAGEQTNYSIALDKFRYFHSKQELGLLFLCDAAWSFSHGNWEKGKDQLHYLSRKESPQPIAKLARGLMRSPSVNHYLKFSVEKRNYHKELWRYIFTAQRPTDEQAYIASSLAVKEARNFAANLGFFIFFDVALRGIKAIFTTPIDTTKVKASGAEYIKLAQSRAESGKLIRKTSSWLASIYKRQRQYGLARRYYEVAGKLTPKLNKKLLNKEANELFRLALMEKNLATKKLIFQSIVENYAETKSAKRAKQELEKTQEQEKIFCRLDYQFLKENPILVESLAIPGELLDGKKSNGEISTAGVVVLKNASLRFTDKNTGLELAPEINAEKFEKFCRLWTELSLAKQNAESLSQSLISRKFPLEITGAIGTSGFDLHPRLLPLAKDPSLQLFK